MEPHPQNCREILAMLSDYVDFELPPGVRGYIEAHLAGCPECLESHKGLRKLISLCHDYAPNPLPKPLSDRARSELEGAWRRMLAGRKHPSTT